MKTHMPAVLAALALSIVAGCSAETPDEPAEVTAATSEALSIGTSRLGYSCTDSGVCQCRGLGDCNDMFGVCKSHLYCNYDEPGGFRCICWDFVARSAPLPAVNGTLMNASP